MAVVNVPLFPALALGQTEKVEDLVENVAQRQRLSMDGETREKRRVRAKKLMELKELEGLLKLTGLLV